MSHSTEIDGQQDNRLGSPIQGFRMPADDGRGREHRGWGPASESLQGTKPREVARGRAGGAMEI